MYRFEELREAGKPRAVGGRKRETEHGLCGGVVASVKSSSISRREIIEKVIDAVTVQSECRNRDDENGVVFGSGDYYEE